jgi:acyl-CoA thioester hydrolase
MRYVTLDEGKSTNHEGAVVDFLKATSLHLDPASLDIRERVKHLKKELELGG